MESRIVFNDLKVDRHDVKVLNRQLEKWLEQHTADTKIEKSSCELTLESNGPHQVICRAHLRVGLHEWVGQDSGKSAQDATIKALKHLHEKRFISSH